jgi:hypothetical protein
MVRKIGVMTVLGVLLGVGGCGYVVRDTWSGANAQLEANHRACLDKANADDLAGTAMGGGGIVGRGVRRTLYKDCMEELGYRKIRSEEISPDGGACGGADQTCMRDPGVLRPFSYRRAY